ncbi:hypothetical protein ATO11_18420 [Pseudaestuariivita atlantica]|uniref:Sulfotransferase domain-containing protein n=1 Tax=Pseudaestuariivita atlantica TaxID=1317121 RepID=A0A0L1JLD9_9RHOB|nr:hypothetical protein ATO11_18420 [Pseudaestuariivita atlantica]
MLFHTPQSGSDALTALLRAHPQLGLHGRLFQRAALPGGVPQTAEGRAAFIEGFWGEAAGPKEQGRTRGLTICVETPKRDMAIDDPVITTLAGYDPAIIVLRRDNWVHQALDRAALKRGKRGKLPEISAQVFDQALRDVRQGYAVMDQMLERFGPVLELSFEELVDDRADTVTLALNHLGLDPAQRDAAAEVPEIADLPELEKVIANPDTLRTMLTGTELDGFV